MTQTSLRKLLEEASEKLEIYKDPDVHDAKEKLSEILKSAGMGDISYDHLVSLHLYEDVLAINTEYSVRGCDDERYIEIPASIIDDEDPVKAAKIWSIKRKINGLELAISAAKKTIEYKNKELDETKKELAALE